MVSFKDFKASIPTQAGIRARGAAIRANAAAPQSAVVPGSLVNPQLDAGVGTGPRVAQGLKKGGMVAVKAAAPAKGMKSAAKRGYGAAGGRKKCC